MKILIKQLKSFLLVYLNNFKDVLYIKVQFARLGMRLHTDNHLLLFQMTLSFI